MDGMGRQAVQWRWGGVCGRRGRPGTGVPYDPGVPYEPAEAGAA